MPTMFSEIAHFAANEFSAIVPSTAPDFELDGVSTSHNLMPNRLAFTKLVEPEFLTRVEAMEEVAVLVPMDAPGASSSFLRVENPRLAFAKIAERFFSPMPVPGIHPTAVIDESADIHSSASVGPFCVIGPNCKIGARTTLKSHVTLSHNVKVGSDCVLWSQTVIGDDGFGVERAPGQLQKHIPHLGGVILGDGVHIGTMSGVAAGTIEPTRIGDGTMLDNHVHVAHNCQIGKNCQLTACVELSGSVVIGDDVTLGPNSSVIQKVSIGTGSVLGIGTVVTKPVPDHVLVAGVPGRILRKLANEGADT